MRFNVRSVVGIAVGAVVLAAVPAFGLTGVADAATGEAGAEGRHARPQLTDEQRQCLADQGVTPPERSADGTRTRPTEEQSGGLLGEREAEAERPMREEQRAALRAAAEACGLPTPADRPGGPGGRPQLTDEQRQCLADQGVTPPERSADGTRTQPTEEQSGGLLGEREAEAERPMREEQRAALRAAAEACGLPTPPARGEAGSGSGATGSSTDGTI